MDIKKLNVSVVVLAQDHNPSILHPSFLSSQKIVPEEWELADPPLCTPPLSMVKYKNGIVFTVETNKLQVLQAPPPEQLAASEVPKLVASYIEKLPHVRYTAVGINIAVGMPHPSPEQFLIDKFLSFKDPQLKSTALRFVFSIDSGVLNLACNPGTIEEAGQGGGAVKLSGIIVNGNYHSELPGDNPLEEAKQVIATFPQRCDHFERTVIRKILE